MIVSHKGCHLGKWDIGCYFSSFYNKECYLGFWYWSGLSQCSYYSSRVRGIFDANTCMSRTPFFVVFMVYLVWGPLSFVAISMVVYSVCGPKVILDSFLFSFFPSIDDSSVANRVYGGVWYLLVVKWSWWIFVT